MSEYALSIRLECVYVFIAIGTLYIWNETDNNMRVCWCESGIRLNSLILAANKLLQINGELIDNELMIRSDSRALVASQRRRFLVRVCVYNTIAD